MSLTTIKNAPVRFLGSSEVLHNNRTCGHRGQKFEQLSQCDDTVAFQVTPSELDGSELLNDADFDFTDNVTNGAFDSSASWTFGGNWAYDSGDDEADCATCNGDILEQTGIVAATTKYQLEYTITNYTQGNLEPDVGGTSATTTSAAATYKELITSGGANTDLEFNTGADFIGSVDDIKLYSSNDWDWTNNSGNMLFDIGNGSVHMETADILATTQSSLFESGKYYKITFTISITSGSLVGVGITGDDDAISETTISTSGTYTYYYYATSGTELVFTADGSDFDGDISSISVVEMSTVGWSIRNFATGNHDYIETDGSNVTYNNGDQPVAVVSFDWETVLGSCVEGCYQICVFDVASDEIQGAINGNLYLGDELILNGGFDDGSNWTISGDSCAQITGGQLEYNCSSPDTAIVLQTISIAANSGTYKLSRNNVQNNESTSSVQIVFTDDNGDPINNVVGSAINIGSTGVQTTNVDTSAWGADATGIAFFRNPLAGNTDLSLDDVSFKKFLNLQESFDSGQVDDYMSCSELYSVKQSHNCTVLLSWTNDDDAFGFNYTDVSFTQYLRVRYSLWHPVYKKDKEIHVDSSGDREILYSNTSKQKELAISEMPEYIHDALSIGLEHDTFNIDGTEYFNEEESYEPIWRRSSLLAPVRIRVEEDGILLENRNC